MTTFDTIKEWLNKEHHIPLDEIGAESLLFQDLDVDVLMVAKFLKEKYNIAGYERDEGTYCHRISELIQYIESKHA